MNINLLKCHIRGAGMTQENVANKIGISLSRFNAKINRRGDAEFSLSELVAIKKICSLTAKQMESIFFDE